MARTLRLLVDEWGWAVVPGADVQAGRCSCGDPHCPDPGRHALSDASWLGATSDPERVRDRWRSHPEAAVVLPVGWCFDLLEVPERGGREALGRLEMMGHRLPPVIATAAGRLLFMVSALDRQTAEMAESGTGASRPAVVPRPAIPGIGGSAAAREAAARDAAAARAVVTDPEPWPTSSSWLASSAGCRPETSIWVGGGAPDAPDVIVRRSGLLVAPLLGAEPPGVTRWLMAPSPMRHALPRMEDVLGPIVRACRDATVRPGAGGARPAGPLRGLLGGQPQDTGTRAGEAGPGSEGQRRDAPPRRPEATGRRPDGVLRRSDAVSDRGAEAGPARGPATLPRRAGVAPGRPEDPPRQPERRVGPELDPAQPLVARLPDGLADADAGDRSPYPARSQLRPRPLERLTRPVPGSTSGRGAGPGPGRVPPPIPAGSGSGRKEPLRVD